MHFSMFNGDKIVNLQGMKLAFKDVIFHGVIVNLNLFKILNFIKFEWIFNNC